MPPFPAVTQSIHDAAIHGDFVRVELLAISSVELNILGRHGESLLESVTSYFAENPALKFRVPMLKLLIERGANPNLLGEDGSSPLTAAMLGRDTELFRTLLAAGADPNLPDGFTGKQSFYDWAVFDYIHEVWNVPPLLAQNPSPEALTPPLQDEGASEEFWLQQLDNQAIQGGLQRPSHLILLRQYGALTAHERSGKTG